MDVIITCHTEFGFVHGKELIFDKNKTSGTSEGVVNLIELADKHGAKITFAVCPEVVNFFPKNIKHEIGLHIHPGWDEREYKGFKWNRGDKYLKENYKQSSGSVFLPDHSYQEQSDLIKLGKEYLQEKLGADPKVFVAGMWALNNDTIKALVENNFTHECSARAHTKSDRYDWSRIPRICMPFNPDGSDYQKKGSLPLLIVPISQTFLGGTMSPEGFPTYGFAWYKACFKEYYNAKVPLFHICLHSPLMTDPYFISAMDEFISFISKHQEINFKFASEIKKYPEKEFKNNIIPYFSAINKTLLSSASRKFLKM